MVAENNMKTSSPIVRSIRRRQPVRQISKRRQSRSYTLLYSGDQSPNELVEAHFRRSLSGAVWADLARTFPLPNVDDHFNRSLCLLRSSSVYCPQTISPQLDGTLSRASESLTSSSSSSSSSTFKESSQPDISVINTMQLGVSVEDHFFKSLGKEWLKIVTHNPHNDYP